jgi:hypothetical protein
MERPRSGNVHFAALLRLDFDVSQKLSRIDEEPLVGSLCNQLLLIVRFQGEG